MGIAGSALGTLLAQVGSAVALVWVVVRGARREHAALRPDLPGIRRAGRAGVPLIMRTLMLRASLLVMTYAAARLGDADLATMQLALTIWTFLAFTLDAVAIAAQAITGRYLGAADADGTRAVTARMERWGWLSGVVTGLLLAALSPVLGGLFTCDPVVRDLLVPVLLVAAVAQPVAGIVFVLDGVLIGAGDAVYLAWAQLVTLAVFAPAAWLVAQGPGLALDRLLGLLHGRPGGHPAAARAWGPLDAARGLGHAQAPGGLARKVRIASRGRAGSRGRG